MIAGRPEPVRFPPALCAALNADPTCADTWAVLLDWCMAHADPHVAHLRDVLRWADAFSVDAYGLRPAVIIAGETVAFRWVAPGTAKMGSPPDEVGRLPREWQHTCDIKGLWMAERPVSGALWQHVMGVLPSRSEKPECPVESVHVADVQAFLKALSLQVARLQPRLPSEAEWETACRAGTTTATWAGDLVIESDYRAAPLDDIAWYGGTTRFDGPSPCADGLPNPLGLEDMLGNVWEWCTGTQGDAFQCRGGSWRSVARQVRSAYRGLTRSKARNDDLGLRLVHEFHVDALSAGRI